MRKYGIAFVPKNRVSEFISLASAYQKIMHNYIIDKTSIPHVTICQFHFDEGDLNKLYNLVSSSISDVTLKINFKKFSQLSFDNELSWISLLPENSLVLNNIYEQALKLVKPIRIDKYDPHLTLFNYKSGEQNGSDKIDLLLESQIEITDEFFLIIGEIDSVGQLTKIVANFTLSSNKTI